MLSKKVKCKTGTWKLLTTMKFIVYLYGLCTCIAIQGNNNLAMIRDPRVCAHDREQTCARACTCAAVLHNRMHFCLWRFSFRDFCFYRRMYVFHYKHHTTWYVTQDARVRVLIKYETPSDDVIIDTWLGFLCSHHHNISQKLQKIN